MPLLPTVCLVRGYHRLKILWKIRVNLATLAIHTLRMPTHPTTTATHIECRCLPIEKSISVGSLADTVPDEKGSEERKGKIVIIEKNTLNNKKTLTET